MSKDEFDKLKTIFNITTGTVENDVERYETVINGKQIVLTFNRNTVPPKRYNIHIVSM